MAAPQSPPGEQISAVGELLAPPPIVAPAATAIALADPQRFIPTPFLTKTYQLVEDLSIDSIISWNEDGTAFVVWNPAEFARDILPKYFKHNNFSSFVRQLNTYGFRKIVPDRWEFSNDCFRKGDKRLLCDIVRRKLIAATVSAVPGTPGVSTSSMATASMVSAPIEPSTSQSGEGQVFSANSSQHSVAAPVVTASVTTSTTMFLDQNSSSSSRAHLIDENDRLKKENTQLCKELSHMKSMCTNIYSMMSNFNPGQGPAGPGPPGTGAVSGTPGAGGCVSTNSSQAESGMVPLDMIAQRRLLTLATLAESSQVQADTVNLDPRLFGFAIGTKRARGQVPDSGGGEPMEQDDYLQLQQPGSKH